MPTSKSALAVFPMTERILILQPVRYAKKDSEFYTDNRDPHGAARPVHVLEGPRPGDARWVKRPQEKLAITTRHRILATILQRVSDTLKKADLQITAQYLAAHLSYQIPAFAKRHKVEVKKDSDSAQELLVKQVGTYDEAALCKLLLEICLLDSAYQRRRQKCGRRAAERCQAVSHGQREDAENSRAGVHFQVQEA
jgi:hypothetical protein